MKEKIANMKIALKKLGLVLLGAVIGISYLVAYTQYFQIKGF